MNQATLPTDLNLSSLLLASLDPSARKQAEAALEGLSTQQGFLFALLQLIIADGGDQSARLAGAVYLKNLVRSRWEEGEGSGGLAEADKTALRDGLVSAILAVSGGGGVNGRIRAQMAESIALIAELDFPEKWPTLIDVSLYCLSRSLFTDGGNSNSSHLSTTHRLILSASSRLYSLPPTPSSAHGALLLVPIGYSQKSTSSSEVSHRPSCIFLE